MKKAPLLDYAFSVAKVRALEKFLIKQQVFEEAIAADLNQALRLFAESDLYSDEILHIRDSRGLEKVLAEELVKLKKLVAELILDKELLGLLELNTLSCVEKVLQVYPSELLADYLLRLVDMYNIKLFLRLYLLGEPEEELKSRLTCEGFLKRADLLKLYNQDLAALLNRLEYIHQHNRTVDYAYSLREAIQQTVEKKSFIYLEKASNDFLMQALLPAKYVVFGPEAVLAYYFAKVNEMDLMRMIILGKLNNVSKDIMQERLNAVYA